MDAKCGLFLCGTILNFSFLGNKVLRNEMKEAVQDFIS
jgi:hypothetical protein